jgi:RNA polymerase sigma-70 factor (ECF subfamily)
MSLSGRLGDESMIAKAREDAAVRGALFEEYRPYLLLVARRSLDSLLCSRIDAEDVVQVTMLRAAKSFPEFAGSTRQQFYRWLIRIHQNTIVEEVVRQRAAKRDPEKERSMQADEESAVIYWLEPLDDQPTPSVRMMRDEQALMLAKQLYALKPEQREAVRLRHIEGWSIAQIAERLQKSETATAGLVKRGLEALRERVKI